MKKKKTTASLDYDPLSVIRKDSFVKELVLKAKDDSGINTIRLINEMTGAHANRGLRALKRDAVINRSQEILIENILANQALRSRVVEIKMEALRPYAFLEEQSDIVKKYVMSKYSEILSEYRTVAERNNVVDNLLKSVARRMSELNQVVSMADLLIDDIDQAGWAIKRIINTLEISISRESLPKVLTNGR